MPIVKASIATGATPTLVQGTTDRKWFILQNQSDTDVFVSMDGTSTITTDTGATPGIKLAANGGSIATGEGEFNPTICNPIYAVHAGGAPKALVLQYV